MKQSAKFLVAACAMTLLSGCTYLDQMTGQTNNTVLPGKREDAIPGRPSFPEKQDVQVGSTTPAPSNGCAANDPACKPPATTNDTFKDPQ